MASDVYHSILSADDADPVDCLVSMHKMMFVGHYFPTYKRSPSQAQSQYQIVLFNNRGTCVNNFPEVVTIEYATSLCQSTRRDQCTTPHYDHIKVTTEINSSYVQLYHDNKLSHDAV